MIESSQTHEMFHEIMKKRWSPRAFDPRPIEEEKIMRLFEAARWAPSAHNDQPWRFVLGIKGDKKYQKILDSLVEWNQRWAKNAPILILNATRKKFSFKDELNNTARYDLGQAVFAMSIEAVNQGLVSHQMSGFDPKKAETDLSLPDDYEAVSVIAVGYHGDKELLPDDLKKAEIRERVRTPLKQLLF